MRDRDLICSDFLHFSIFSFSKKFSSWVIDKEIIRYIVSCIANDIINSKEIKTVEDKKVIQEDLNKIYEWEEKNVMKFNEGKIEKIKINKR